MMAPPRRIRALLTESAGWLAHPVRVQAARVAAPEPRGYRDPSWSRRRGPHPRPHQARQHRVARAAPVSGQRRPAIKRPVINRPGEPEHQGSDRPADEAGGEQGQRDPEGVHVSPSVVPAGACGFRSLASRGCRRARAARQRRRQRPRSGCSRGQQHFRRRPRGPFFLPAGAQDRAAHRLLRDSEILRRNFLGSVGAVRAAPSAACPPLSTAPRSGPAPAGQSAAAQPPHWRRPAPRPARPTRPARPARPARPTLPVPAP